MRFNKQTFKGGCNNPSLNMRHQARILYECIWGGMCQWVAGSAAGHRSKPAYISMCMVISSGYPCSLESKSVEFSLSPITLPCFHPLKLAQRMFMA
jgi:hypothetical protein